MARTTDKPYKPYNLEAKVNFSLPYEFTRAI